MTIRQVIKFFGSQQNAIDEIGVHKSTFSSWKARGIPSGQQYRIEVITDGQLKADSRKSA